MANNQMTDPAACDGGWYYDSVFQQPIFLFWRDAQWWGRFVWRETLLDAAVRRDTTISTEDIALTYEVYYRLIRLDQMAQEDYIKRGGSALFDVHGIRNQVQVIRSEDGRGIYIQTPASTTHTPQAAGCDAIWLSDDEIPMIIRALQARRREILDPQSRSTKPPIQED